eukprot:3356245-Prymnesium_polylepis.1
MAASASRSACSAAGPGGSPSGFLARARMLPRFEAWLSDSHPLNPTTRVLIPVRQAALPAPRGVEARLCAAEPGGGGRGGGGGGSEGGGRVASRPLGALLDRERRGAARRTAALARLVDEQPARRAGFALPHAVRVLPRCVSNQGSSGCCCLTC